MNRLMKIQFQKFMNFIDSESCQGSENSGTRTKHAKSNHSNYYEPENGHAKSRRTSRRKSIDNVNIFINKIIYSFLKQN